uniref:Uncharacterized protein n=1 Tax=Arundo donax TaxID=35708 RepID=A0A0A9BGJ0_ARUDO
MSPIAWSGRRMTQCASMRVPYVTTVGRTPAWRITTQSFSTLSSRRARDHPLSRML